MNKGRPRSFDRNEVLEKAMLAFWDHGFEATSISELSDVMGLNPPSIYGAFGDKKTLFLEAVARYTGDLSSIETSILSAPTSFDAAKKMLTDSAVAFTGVSTPKGCLLASSTAATSEGSNDVKESITAIRKKIEGFLRKKIEQDVSDGLMNPAILGLDLAGFTIATIQGISVLARDGASRKKLLTICETALKAWPK